MVKNNIRFIKPVKIIKEEKSSQVVTENKLKQEVETFFIKLNTIKWQVIYCLNKYPSTRESDDLLERRVYEEFYWVTQKTTYWELKEKWVPPVDLLKRIRARLNTKGYFMPTSPRVIKKRLMLRWKFQKFFIKY